MARPKKKDNQAIDFKIHLPEFSCKLQPSRMMFNPSEYRQRAIDMEQQITDLTVGIQLLMQEVISNRRMILTMQEQLKAVAKG